MEPEQNNPGISLFRTMYKLNWCFLSENGLEQARVRPIKHILSSCNLYKDVFPSILLLYSARVRSCDTPPWSLFKFPNRALWERFAWALFYRTLQNKMEWKGRKPSGIKRPKVCIFQHERKNSYNSNDKNKKRLIPLGMSQGIRFPVWILKTWLFSQPARHEGVKGEGPGRAKKKGNSPLSLPSRSPFNAATDASLVSHTFHWLSRQKKGGNLSLSLVKVIGV